MQHLEYLRDRFPETPEHIILKADLFRRGVAFDLELDDLAMRSCTTGLLTKDERQSVTAPGQFHFSENNTTVDTLINEKSPYHIVENGPEDYHLQIEDRDLGKIHFTPRPDYYGRKTSEGRPCEDYLVQRGPHCLLVTPVNSCAYFHGGDTCRFCGLSVAMESERQSKNMPMIPDYDIVGEAVAIAREYIDLREIKLNGGSLYNLRKEAECIEKCLSGILKAAGPIEEATVFSQALEEDAQRRLKDAGATNVFFDMEAWNERLWPQIVPGKAKTVGREEWLRRLEKAVEIFGAGHVACNFVAGFEAAPFEGFLSQEESLQSYLEGFAWLTERGIAPSFTVWIPLFEWESAPQAEYFLELGSGLHELMMQHDLYRDLGFSRLGVDPPTLGLYCYYCRSMQLAQDYPRLINRETPPTPSA
ncbi:MAG: radical SAM protein [Planctomycetota bacterium]|jgi:hypothetical protein